MSVNLKEVQLKLYEQLKPSGWADKLKMFILSDEFYTILETLLKQSTEGKKFTPTIKHLFRAFEQCPYDKLRVIFVGQDPYPKEGVADGIAFSCSKTSHPSQIQPSLRKIYQALNDEGVEHKHTYDLKDWANQGILMLNTALTTQVGVAGAHTELWKPFMRYLFEVLNTSESGLVYVFMGKVAQSWKSYIDEDGNHIFVCSHPASAVYSPEGRWDSSMVFSKTTDVVKRMYNQEIKW
jgi:uracil-DNA glycosylase